MNKRVLAIYLPSCPKKEQLADLAGTLLSVSPTVGIRPPDTLYLEISSVTRLWGKEEAIVSHLLSTLTKKGISAHMAIADHTATAGLLARSVEASRIVPSGKDEAALASYPIEGLRFLVNPFSPPTSQENSATEKMLQVLSLLRIQTLGDFARIPAASVGTRFGKQGSLLQRRARGEDAGSWSPFSPTQPYRESIEFEAPVETLEPILFSAKAILSKLETRLRKDFFSALQMTLYIETEDGKETELAIPLLRPLRKEKSLLGVARERLANLELSSPIMALSIELSLPVRDRGSQLHLYNQREEQSEKLDELLGRLVAGVGPTFISAAVLRERYRPEKAWKPAPFEAFSTALPALPAPSPSPERPSILVHPPEPLVSQSQQETLVLRSKNSRYEVQNLSGPERLKGEWWDGGAHARDYFRAETKKGEHLWIFKPLTSPSSPFYLHGFFD